MDKFVTRKTPEEINIDALAEHLKAVVPEILTRQSRVQQQAMGVMGRQTEGSSSLTLSAQGPKGLCFASRVGNFQGG